MQPEYDSKRKRRGRSATFLTALISDLRLPLQRFLPKEMAFVLTYLGIFSYTEEQIARSKDDLCCWAAKHGFLTLFNWSKARQCRCNCADVQMLAAAHGHMGILKVCADTLKWRLDLSGVIQNAAKGGQLAVLEWLLKWRGATFDNLVYATASAEGGNVEVMKFLIQHRCTWNSSVYPAAWAHGHLAMLNWLKQMRCPFEKANHRYYYQFPPHQAKEMFSWMHQNGIPWDGVLVDNVAYTGSLETLKWLLDMGCPRGTGTRTCDNAAFGGHLEVLIWLVDNYFPLNPLQVCVNAARKGHLKVLEWCEEKGYYSAISAHTSCFVEALESGHLPTIQWVQNKEGAGRILRFDACVIAAYEGHLHVLKWLREYGYPWDSRVCTRAAERGFFEVLKYAHENGCPLNTTEALRALGARWRTSALFNLIRQYLHERA